MSEKKNEEIINEPYELKEDDVEIIEAAEDEKEELCGAKESFEDSEERPNEK